MDDNRDGLRVTIIAIILAALFGVLQYIPKGTTWYFLDAEGVLSIFSNVSFGIVLLVFLIYVILLSLKYTYTEFFDREGLKKFTAVFYDIGAVLSFCILTATIGEAVVANILNGFPSFFGPHVDIGAILIFLVLVIVILPLGILISRIVELNRK